MGRQVKANFGELFKKILNEFGRIMERIGMRNEERVCLQYIMRFWCGNEVSFLQTSLVTPVPPKEVLHPQHTASGTRMK
jgi:hypothetical protein